MKFDWAGLVGCMAGHWRLESLIRVADGKADFAASNGQKAWVRVLREDDPRAGEAHSSWELSQKLQHDNLIRVYDFGQAEMDEIPMLYAAFEWPDDEVAEILATRALEADEERSMIAAVKSGLAYLHERGLSHGSVKPANLFIVGEAVKLSVDMVAPGDGGSDLRQLKQLAAHDTAEPVLATQAKRTSGNRRWLAGAGAGIAVVGILAYRSITNSPGEFRQLVYEPAPVAAKSPEPTLPKPAPAVAAAKPSSSAWAVVAATYNSYEAASKRARRLMDRWPKLQPRVYPTDGRGSKYYVVLGARSSRTEAEKLLRQVRRQGAPGDTYVTKMSDI